MQFVKTTHSKFEYNLNDTHDTGPRRTIQELAFSKQEQIMNKRLTESLVSKTRDEYA